MVKRRWYDDISHGDGDGDDDKEDGELVMMKSGWIWWFAWWYYLIWWLKWFDAIMVWFFGGMIWCYDDILWYDMMITFDHPSSGEICRKRWHQRLPPLQCEQTTPYYTFLTKQSFKNIISDVKQTSYQCQQHSFLKFSMWSIFLL